MAENIIRLDFRTPKIEEDAGSSWLGCKNCKNKTFTLVYDAPDSFPMLNCACCGEEIGRMGWWHDN